MYVNGTVCTIVFCQDHALLRIMSIVGELPVIGDWQLFLHRYLPWMIIILSEKFCTLGYPNSCDPQVDEHYKFKSQRWQLISSLQCQRRNSNEISVCCFMSRRIGYKSSKTYTVCPWRYKNVDSQSTKQIIAHGNIKMLYHKSKTVFKFRSCKTCSTSYSTQHWHIHILWKQLKLLYRSTHQNIP